MAHGKLAWLFLGPDSGLDHCPIILLSCFRARTSAKVANRVEKYEVNIISDLREDKKLLVLDIDYTLFDHKTPAETGAELMRPYLHDFLTSAYKVHYVPVIRSQLHCSYLLMLT